MNALYREHAEVIRKTTSICLRRFHLKMGWDEAMAIGNLAFVYATKHYDSRKGAFPPRLITCITQHFRAIRRRENRLKRSLCRTVPLDSLKGLAAEDSFDLAQFLLELGQDATYMVTLYLGIPYERFRPNTLRRKATKILQKEGWDEERISRVHQEIQDTLTGDCS